MTRVAFTIFGLLSGLLVLAWLGWTWQLSRSEQPPAKSEEEGIVPSDDLGVGQSHLEQEVSSMSAESNESSNDLEQERRFANQRETMVRRQLASRDINDPQVLAAFQKVPRHRFVPEDLWNVAYHDGPLPIGHDQTISQPYIVALMTQLAGPRPDAKALDIGTGSGYQAAILAELVDQVFTIEIVEPLAERAKELLQDLGYKNIVFRSGDGYRGWPEEAPFDLIIVAAAPEQVPPALLDQLAPEGRLVIPVGGDHQTLLLIEKRLDGTLERKQVSPVRFVPMTGEAQGEP